MSKSNLCDANYIREVISRVHSSEDWLVLDEFPLDAGKRNRGTPRIDILAIKIRKGGGYGRPLTREAYEIKVDRRDFLNELQNPQKRQRAYAVCDSYWFAVPEGLVDEDEVPPECGLMWVCHNRPVPTAIKMPADLNTNAPSSLFMMDVARRAYQIGRRHGTTTCAFERFDLLCRLAHMLIKNDATVDERKAAVQTLSKTLVSMQRHTEARELSRIANGYEPSWSWFVPKTLQGSMKSIDSEICD